MKIDNLNERYAQIRREIEVRRTGIHPRQGRERLEDALRELGVWEAIRPERVILVAGTNGKGSTAACLATLLGAAGERVGLFTSPHLVEPTERVRVGEREISRELFVRAYEVVRERTGAAGDGAPEWNFFELLTLMAAWIFFSGEAGAPVDRAIFEVGLGGLLDPTNAIPHRPCVIARLGMDHVAELGPTLLDIARNKFGIVGPGALVVHAPFRSAESAGKELGKFADEIRARTDSRWVEAARYEFKVVRDQTHEPEFRIDTEWGSVRIPLPGARGAENAALALTTFRELGFDPTRYMSVLEIVRWPGRMQRISMPGASCPVYLSGDHNPQGIESLAEVLSHYEYQRVHFLVAVNESKDAGQMLEILSRVRGAQLHLTRFPGSREWCAAEGARAVSVTDSFREGLAEIIRRAKAEDLVVVTGSLHLVGAMLGDNLRKLSE